MFNEFFVVSETYANFASAIRDDNQTIVEKCPMCGAIFEKRKYNKIKVHFSGKKEGDYYFVPICNIVSERLLETLREAEITGFSEKEIECSGWYDKKGNKLPINISKYKELVVNGRTGNLLSKDGKEVLRCPKCNALRGTALDKVNGLSVGNEWDGSDIFYFKNWEGPIIVTKKVKVLLEKKKMKNIIFKDLEDFIFK